MDNLFKHHIELAIRYGDLDTLGHVNNAKYATYIEQARVTYVNELGLWDGSPSEMGLILARIEIDFKAPLIMADKTVIVWTRCSRLGNKSFDMMHQVVTPSGKLAATCKAVGVVYNYKHECTIPMPDDWRKRLIAYEPGL
ncbi:MAG: acyl-CoA thioesterase [Chloroflexi bacterium]|nr:MAG: acyl-CoA thioesterase [Chloroflexota bacterium]